MVSLDALGSFLMPHEEAAISWPNKQIIDSEILDEENANQIGCIQTISMIKS